MRRSNFLLSLALMATTGWGIASAFSVADDAQPGGAKVVAEHRYRASTIMGTAVRNQANESVGKINDLVIDLESGKINYAAVSVGGFLGIGDKLFAIPWSEFTYKHGEKDNYFVLDISKERLKDAPGFDQNHWPDVADSNWRRQIDEYYHRSPTDQAKRPVPRTDSARPQ